MNAMQLGRFIMSMGMVNTNTELVGRVFSKLHFIPVRVNVNMGQGQMEFIGISPEFKEIKPGMVAPSYDIDVAQPEGEDDISITVTKTPVKKIVSPTRAQVHNINKKVH
jgi:hypothetical protein